MIVLLGCSGSSVRSAKDAGTKTTNDGGKQRSGSLVPIGSGKAGQGAKADAASADDLARLDSLDASAAANADGGRANTDAATTTQLDASSAHAADSGPRDGAVASTLASDAGTCTDTTSDPSNCGACGYACVNGRSCVSSRCTPAWQSISSAGAPSARNRHAAAAFHGLYVVVGGTLAANGSGPAIASAGSYDPVMDGWGSFPSLAQARCAHAAISTAPESGAGGGDVLVFGGLTDCSDGRNTGPGLEVSTNGGAWQTMSISGEPVARYNFAVARSAGHGADLFMFGGSTNSQPAIASAAFLTLSGAGAPKWTNADCPLSQCERGGNYSIFVDGNHLRAWGGGPYGSAPSGLQYDFSSNTWASWVLPDNTPTLPQYSADDGRRIYFLSATSMSCPHTVEVLIYDRKTSTWLPKDATAAPAGLLAQAATAWVGSEMIAWSGNCGAGASSVGGRYQPPAPP